VNCQLIKPVRTAGRAGIAVGSLSRWLTGDSAVLPVFFRSWNIALFSAKKWLPLFNNISADFYRGSPLAN